MAVNRSCSLILASALGVFGWCAAVQGESSLSEEQNKLARMEQTLENRLVELEDFENEVLAYEYKLARAQESLAEARSNHDKKRVEVKTAEREHKLAANSAAEHDAERALRKAKHAGAMAERGVDSRKRRVEFIQSTYGGLEARVKMAETSVTEGKSHLEAQQKRVDLMVQSMLVQAEAQKKAALQDLEGKTPSDRPDIPDPSVASLEVAAPSISAPEPVKSAATEPRAVDPEMLEYVRGERERLEKLLAELGDGEKGTQTFRSLSLRASGEDPINFEFLGQNQYRLLAPVSAGRQTYKINTWRFRRTIPASDDGARYVFIFDARRLARPRLVMYPEDALKQLD